ncbi:MAG: potassium transporter TrkA [Arcobacter sp.]|nr:MAG: potassium transporter TrkA [Arcobacter sp.]
MKNVLVILDGQIAKHLLKRMIELNNNLNQYDIIYTDDTILPDDLPSNFTLYKFDPTSYSKLFFVLNKVLYQDALLVLATKEDTEAVVENIRKKYKDLNFNVYDKWGLELNDKNIQYYRGKDVISNGLVELLPNIPVFAQNIGLKQGEIMEIKITFGSTYAYRYIGSIAQKDWRIVALYRNQKLLTVKASLIIKPNDTIVIIGKPKVLLQVYNAVSKLSSQFPMPFGQNIYLYIDMYIQSEKEIIDAIQHVRILHKRLKSFKLVVKITRHTTLEMIDKIKKHLKDIENLVISNDYYSKSMQKILKEDKKKFDAGMIVLTKSLLGYREIVSEILALKIPIFKVGSENISSLKSSLVLLNDNNLYEQISPILFDISSQLKITPKILDIDPMGDSKREDLVSHLKNLSKIFNQNIVLVSEKTNPIKRLSQEQDVLQILPLKAEMFKKRKVKFFSTDSDLLSYDSYKFNQILIPVIDNLK